MGLCAAENTAPAQRLRPWTMSAELHLRDALLEGGILLCSLPGAWPQTWAVSGSHASKQAMLAFDRSGCRATRSALALLVPCSTGPFQSSEPSTISKPFP